MDLGRGLETLLVAAAVAALAPVLVALLPGPRIPQVVVLLAGGVLIGPQVLGWADRPAIDLLANVGLGFLFLMAGYELDLHLFRERPGRLAIVAWLVTVALAAAKEACNRALQVRLSRNFCRRPSHLHDSVSGATRYRDGAGAFAGQTARHPGAAL